MKKIMLYLSLAVLLLSFQTQAATLSWVSTPNTTGHVANTAGSSADGLVGTYAGGIAAGAIHDTWVFNVADASAVNALINVQEFINSTVGLTVKLDGALLNFDVGGLWSFSGFLLAGNHTISLDGSVRNISRTTKSNVSIGIGSVPVPAAFWLFGSALLGAFGLKSRNKSTLAYPTSA
jgi:hypothetical protein